MAASGDSIAVFDPKAGSRGRHNRNLSLKGSAQFGGDAILLCRTVSFAVAACYMKNVGFMPERSPSNDRRVSVVSSLIHLEKIGR